MDARRTFSSTIRFLISTGLPADQADDAAQAGWSRGWKRRKQLVEPSKIVSWINKTSLNLFRNRLRKKRPTEEVPDLACRPRINANTIDVRRALEKRPRDEIRLLRSYYVEGYTSCEVGQREGCSTEALRVRVFRIKKRLMADLGLKGD